MKKAATKTATKTAATPILEVTIYRPGEEPAKYSTGEFDTVIKVEGPRVEITLNAGYDEEVITFYGMPYKIVKWTPDQA